MKTGTITVAGGSIFYRVYGYGEPLVFLHGGPGTPHDYLVSSFLSLEEDLQLIFFDQRGTGRSDYDYEKPLGFNVCIDDIHAITEELCLTRFHLIGHSFGGALAAVYASMYTDKILSMTLISTAPGNASYNEEIEQLSKAKTSKADMDEMRDIIAMDPISNKDLDAINRIIELQTKSRFYNQSFIQKPLFETFDSFMKSQIVNRAFDDELDKFDIYPMLHKISCKTLILHGRHDTIPLSVPESFHKLIPNSRFVVFERSGHFPFIEEKDEVLKSLKSFLTD